MLENNKEDDKCKISSILIIRVKIKFFLLLTNDNFTNLETLISPIISAVNNKTLSEPDLINLFQYACEILKE